MDSDLRQGDIRTPIIPRLAQGSKGVPLRATAESSTNDCGSLENLARGKCPVERFDATIRNRSLPDVERYEFIVSGKSMQTGIRDRRLIEGQEIEIIESVQMSQSGVRNLCAIKA